MRKRADYIEAFFKIHRLEVSRGPAYTGGINQHPCGRGQSKRGRSRPQNLTNDYLQISSKKTATYGSYVIRDGFLWRLLRHPCVPLPHFSRTIKLLYSLPVQLFFRHSSCDL